MELRLIAGVLSTVSLAFAQAPLRFDMKRFEKKSAHCAATFDYPEVISAASPTTRDRINAGILRVLLRRTEWPATDSGFRSVDAYASNSIQACTDFQTHPDARALYERKRVTILRSLPPVLSFRCDATQDGGGVHPFGTTFFVNFDARTGKGIALKDLLQDAALPKLESIAEAILRRNRHLSPSARLSDNGYRFPGDRFHLNGNFGIGDNQLLFVFNTYEIGPGAMGMTEIGIPYPEIRSLLKVDLQPPSP